MSCSSNSLLPSTHASAEMPPPRPPPRRPPRAQAQYAAHALQAHGALPPRPPPADPAVTTAIEVLEASARYAESQIDARSRDAAVDAALGACARALSRGEVPLVAPAAQAAARVAQLASGAPNTLPRLAQLVDQLVGWALDVSMERRDARALTDNLARFGLNCWRSERVVAQTLVRNLDQDLSRLSASARDETQVIQVASVARCLSAVLRNLERDAAHAQTCSRFVDALLSARTAAQEPHAWDDVCHELCIDLLKGSDFRLIEQPYGRCLEQQLTAVTTHALDAVGADSSKSSAKHARRCGRAAGRVAAWLSVQGPLSGGGASEILGSCLDSTPSNVSTAFRDCRRSLVIQDANKEPYTTLFEARKKLAKALAALATLARQPERVARAASTATDADDYAFFLDAALRDVDGSARLCEAAPQNNNRDNWDAWCRTASSVAKGAAQPARSRGAGAAARREALEKALQALCSAPSFEGECFQALTALCDALPHGAGVKALETREALATKALPSLIKRLQRRPVSNKDLNHAGPAFAACASRLASGDDQYVDSAATASLQVITSLGGGGDGSVACIRGLGRPKAEGDRDATLQLVSRAQESSSGDLAALFVEDTTDDTQPLEVAVIDLEEHVTPALKTRHERDGDARACLLALLRPQTRVSVSKSTTPHKKGKRPPALLLRRPGTPPPDTDDDDDSAAHRARAASPPAFAKTAATQIVSQLLRSCLGDPAQTLERISNDAKEAAMRGDRAQRVNILALVDALEREMGRVAETRPSTLPDDVQVLLGNNESDGEEEDNRPPWEVAFFFRQNRKVCDAWLSQIRKDAAVCALRSGSFAQASYHAAHDCSACALQLKEVRAKVTQSKKTPKAEIDAIRRFEDALAVLALARTALGDGAGVRGLHRWHRDVADSSDGKRRGWWLEAAADVCISVVTFYIGRA